MSKGADPPEPKRRWLRGWKLLVFIVALLLILSGLGFSGFVYYADGVNPPTAADLTLPEATTVYYSDGTTVLARLGTDNRTILTYDDMLPSVTQAIVASEDNTFWTNKGVDFKGVLRAAVNNVTGGDIQGASTITQQYARLVADLKGVTYSRKLREAIIAWKITRNFSKEEILANYLNSVPFGRGAYGVEAAAQVYFGKSASKSAPADQQLTTAEAMLLAEMVKQPYPDPVDPEHFPGYDPTYPPGPENNPIAVDNAKSRWEYVRQGMITLGYLTPAQAADISFPTTVVEDDPASRTSGLDKPTGQIVRQVLSEMRQTDAFRDKPAGFIENGGYHIVTTIDARAEQAALDAADITQDKAPSIVQGQPADWQAALVAVEPGTGRVLAYYGGDNGVGADYAGWYYEQDGTPSGFGEHPPGSTFKVFDLTAAVAEGISTDTIYDSPPTKEFPASGRTNDSPAGPVSNDTVVPCMPDKCTLVDAIVNSLNVPFFALTEQLGTKPIIDMAHRMGINDIWDNVAGQTQPQRIDLRGLTEPEMPGLSTEVGIGQYGVTVLDEANAMATLAAGGQAAKAHFVKEVRKGRDAPSITEDTSTTSIGLSQDQIAEIDDALKQVVASNFDPAWDSAGKTGTWQAGTSTTENAHTWMVGYTPALAAAVWLGTTDGKALIASNGEDQIFGATYPGPIWQQFMGAASTALGFDPADHRFPALPTPSPSASPEPSESPSESPSPEDSASPAPSDSQPASPSPAPPTSATPSP